MWLERGGDGEWWGGHAGGFCTYLVAHPRSVLLRCALVFWLVGTAADNEPSWLIVMHSLGSLDLTKVRVWCEGTARQSWPQKCSLGQERGMGGQWRHIGGLAMHLLAFIFVLCLLFVFFVPFFTVVAVFQMGGLQCTMATTSIF